MIHWTPEGMELKNGLNVFWLRLRRGWYFRAVLVWSNHGYYLRFRTYLRPHFYACRLASLV